MDVSLAQLQAQTLDLIEAVEREHERESIAELARVSLALGTRAMLIGLRMERDGYRKAGSGWARVQRSAASQLERAGGAR